MKRRHLIEIEDQSWCPQGVRNGITDYLGFALDRTKHYTPAIPLLAQVLKRAGASRVIDLCSGGGGPWLELQQALAEMGTPVRVSLSDKYPNLEAFRQVHRLSKGAIDYITEPVDATRVRAESSAFRTMFTSFHHFRPEDARAILADAVEKQKGIAVFEATERTALMVFLTMSAPLHALLVTPFIRPFRWSRLLWTYIIPLVPLTLLIDGLVSCFRTYTVEELKQMTNGLQAQGYQWDIGQIPSRVKLVKLTYVIGLPSKPS
jgi:hypothetical protein